MTQNADLREALCAKTRYSNPIEYDWYSEDPSMMLKCKRVCGKCPAKKTCAQQALSAREPWGIWGGMDEFRTRRALGLDSMGRNRVYSRAMVCPYCFSEDLDIARKKETQGYPVHCNYCGVEWESYRVPDKIRRTLKRQHDTILEISLGDTRD